MYMQCFTLGIVTSTICIVCSFYSGLEGIPYYICAVSHPIWVATLLLLHLLMLKQQPRTRGRTGDADLLHLRLFGILLLLYPFSLGGALTAYIVWGLGKMISNAFLLGGGVAYFTFLISKKDVKT